MYLLIADRYDGNSKFGGIPPTSPAKFEQQTCLSGRTVDALDARGTPFVFVSKIFVGAWEVVKMKESGPGAHQARNH